MKAWVARGVLIASGVLAGCGSASDGEPMSPPPTTPAVSPGGCAPGTVCPPATNAPIAPAPTGMTAVPVAGSGAMNPVMGPTMAPSMPSGSAGAPATMPTMPPSTQPMQPAGEPDWEMIITADWQLEPNEERYFCQRVTLKEDTYFTAVKAVNPPGTHHTALTAAASASMPDGLTECNSSGLAPQGIFGSGVGTDPVTYPPGVGLKLRKGQQLLLNLHVFNVTDKPLRGTSGTAVVRAKAEEVKQVAESLLAGPARFSVPVGRSSVKGKCSMTHDVTLFAVQPHMHQTGVHMKGVAHSSMMGDVTVHDGPFNFENQLVYSIKELPMKKGDVVDVECTFDNMTDRPITFGESSNQEMCFLVLHRYPAATTPAISCFF